MENVSESNVNKNTVLIITTLACLVTCLIPTAIPIALPSIGKEFSMEAILLGWVATSFVLASAVTMVPFGRIADIYGRRKIFTYGILLFAISAFLCAISNSTIMLISFRALQGIGGAMVWVPTVAILTSVFTAEERGRAIGINTGAVYVGLSLGPFFGGLLTQHFGWRSIFYFIALLSALVAIFAFWKLKEEWAESRGEKFDIVGSLLLSISLIVIAYGFTVLPTTLGIVLVLLGVLGLLVFARFEAKTESPLLNVSLFRKNSIIIIPMLITCPLCRIVARVPAATPKNFLSTELMTALVLGAAKNPAPRPKTIKIKIIFLRLDSSVKRDKR